MTACLTRSEFDFFPLGGELCPTGWVYNSSRDGSALLDVHAATGSRGLCSASHDLETRERLVAL